MARPAAAADVFHAIADPTRRRVLDLLAEEEHSVSDLVDEFRISQPAVSQHLRVLRDVGLVEESRSGRFRFYRLNPAPLREVVDWAARYEKFWPQRLAALGRVLDDLAAAEAPPPRKRRSTR
jgi:DNA-binding transcriptional ArsR family regulator